MAAAVPVALGLIAVLVVGLVWLQPLFVAFVLALLLMAMWELHRGLRDHAQATSAIVPAMAGAALTIVAAYLPAWPSGGELIGYVCMGAACDLPEVPGTFDLLGPSAVILVAGLGLTVSVSLIWLLHRGTEGYVRAASATLFVLAYPAFLGVPVLLLALDRSGPAKLTLFALVIVCADTGGHAAGVFLGQHPMAPKISPKKSWEGAAGSLLLAPVGALVVKAIALDSLVWWKAVIAAEIIAVVGILGDLVESAVKRDLGIKDLGSILPGHGGVMDRIDSYLGAAPVAWLTLTLLVPYG
jgi:phosphatidate cytidylyltransferase